VHFVSRLGRDPFADMARATWAKAGVIPEITEDPDSYTGAAYIFVEDATGNNAIIVSPGAAGRISVADIEARADLIGGASVFVTQLEQPMDAAHRALEIARAGRRADDPEPRARGRDRARDAGAVRFRHAERKRGRGDHGRRGAHVADADRAAGALLAQGVGAAIITLGEKGALYRDAARTVHVPVYDAGPGRARSRSACCIRCRARWRSRKPR
jgi:ribokinase